MSYQNLFSKGVNKGLDTVGAAVAAFVANALGLGSMQSMVTPLPRWADSSKMHRSAGGRANRRWRKRRAAGRS